MPTPMPYIPGAIREYLLHHDEIQDLLHGGTITTRNVPDPLTVPHVTVATVGGTGADPMLRHLTVQVTPWAPAREISHLDEDPDVTAWNLAATAGEILGRARNIIIDKDHAWSARWIDGPVQLYDTSRGADRILFYAPVRLTVNIRRRSRINNT